MTSINRRPLLAILLALLPVTARAIPAFVSDGGYSTSGTSSLSATAPSGVSVGDLLVICANLQTTVAQGTLNTPTGFTSAGSTGAATDGGGGFVNTYLFYKVAVTADTTASNYTIAYNTGGTFNQLAANVRDYTGTAAASPLDFSAFVLTSASSVTNVVPALGGFTSGEIYVGCSASDVNVDIANLTTSAATGSGSTLTFTSTAGQGLANGQSVADITTTGVIPDGTTISSFTGTTVVLSNPVTGGGVANGDVIVFDSVNPVLHHVFDPSPFVIRIYMGDYLPGSTPGTETFTYNATTPGRTGWGATFKPLGGGGGGGGACGKLPLLGAGC